MQRSTASRTSIGAVALTGALAAAGLILGHIARWFADGLAVNSQLFFHAFRLASLRSPWVHAPMHFLSGAVLQYSAIACWGIGWGYVIGDAESRHRQYRLAAFAASVAIGALFTTTSVRQAQSELFAQLVWTIVNPLVAAAACVIPAVLSARAARRRSWRYESVLLVGVALAGLSVWSAADVRYALAYGCVPIAALSALVCPSAQTHGGTAIVGALSCPIVYMVWHVVRPGARE
jgi:hypothetical protein